MDPILILNLFFIPSIGVFLLNKLAEEDQQLTNRDLLFNYGMNVSLTFILSKGIVFLAKFWFEVSIFESSVFYSLIALVSTILITILVRNVKFRIVQLKQYISEKIKRKQEKKLAKGKRKINEKNVKNQS